MEIHTIIIFCTRRRHVTSSEQRSDKTKTVCVKPRPRPIPRHWISRPRRD